MDKWLNNVMVIRLIALAIGILLWFVVHIDEDVANIERGVSVPATKERLISNVAVRRTGLDQDRFHVTSVEPTTVNVVLRGKAEDINKLSTKDGNSQIIADLSNVSVGSNTIYLEPRGFPNGVEVSIRPNSVSVQIEEVQEKEMRVSVQTTGEPAPGFKPGTPIVTPNRIHIAGPQSELERVDRVVATVDLTGVEEAVQDDYKLAALDANGEPVNVRITPTVVNVEVPVTSPFKTMPLQIKLTGQTPTGYGLETFSQSVSEITVYGSEDVLDDLDFYEGAVIDLGELTQSRSFTIPIPLGQGVERVLPETVTVDFRVVPSEQRTIEGVPITFIGGTDGFEAELTEESSQTIDVVVEGAPARLADLTAEDIQAFIDVSNLPAGTHTRQIKFNLPLYIKSAGNENATGRFAIRAVDEPAAANPEPTPTAIPSPTPAPSEEEPPSVSEGSAGGGETPPEVSAEEADSPFGRLSRTVSLEH